MTKSRQEQWARMGEWAVRMWWFSAGLWFPSIMGMVAAAETLPAVSPPTDWTFVIAAVGVAIVFGLVVAYVQWIKHKAGMQFGEEFIDQVADKLHAKMNPPPTESTNPLTYDGHTFLNAEELAKYKAAKVIIDSYGAAS